MTDFEKMLTLSSSRSTYNFMGITSEDISTFIKEKYTKDFLTKKSNDDKRLLLDTVQGEVQDEYMETLLETVKNAPRLVKYSTNEQQLLGMAAQAAREKFNIIPKGSMYCALQIQSFLIRMSVEAAVNKMVETKS